MKSILQMIILLILIFTQCSCNAEVQEKGNRNKTIIQKKQIQRTLSTEEIEKRFLEVSKKVALRYYDLIDDKNDTSDQKIIKDLKIAKISRYGLIPSCNELIILLEQLQITENPSEFELRNRIMSLGYSSCLIYKKYKNTAKWVEERDVKWNQLTKDEDIKNYEKEILNSSSDHPYIQFAKLTNFGQDESKQAEVEELIKKYPDFLEGYYYLIHLRDQPDEWYDKIEEKYFQEAKKQQAWDHLYYLTMVGEFFTTRIRTDGSNCSKAIDYLLEQRVNPESNWNPYDPDPLGDVEWKEELYSSKVQWPKRFTCQGAKDFLKKYVYDVKNDPEHRFDKR